MEYYSVIHKKKWAIRSWKDRGNLNTYYFVNKGSMKRHSWNGHGWCFQPYDILGKAKTTKMLKPPVVSREEGWVGATKDFQGSETLPCDIVLLQDFPVPQWWRTCLRCKTCGLALWAGKILWGGRSNPLQYSCLENPMDWGAWWATIYRQQGVGHDWSNYACTHSGTVMLYDMHFSNSVKLWHK